MSRNIFANRRAVFLAAFLFLTITPVAAFLIAGNSLSGEDGRAVEIAKRYANPPENATLNVFTLERSGLRIKSVEWDVPLGEELHKHIMVKVDTDSWQVIGYLVMATGKEWLEEDAKVLKEEALNIAVDFAKKQLGNTFEYLAIWRISFSEDINNWIVLWKPVKNGYVAIDQDFAVYVNAETGEICGFANYVNLQRLERLPTPKIGREEAMKLAEEKVGGTATKALLAVVEKTPAWMVTVTKEEEIYAHVYVDPENGEILNIEVLP